MSTTEQDDWVLLDAWRAGDRKAGDTLVQRHFRPIARFFHNKVANEEDAADLIGQTFLGCTESKDRFRGDVPFERFAFRIALKVFQQHLRKKYKREREALDFDSLCLGSLAEVSLTTVMARKDNLRRLASAMRNIPLDFQIALELNIFENLPGREIAELLGIPEATVRGRLRLGKQRLAEQLQQIDRGAAAMLDDPVSLRTWAKEIRTLMDRPSNRD
ncbi:MAG: sigma-70 family RNA polymerase sigma factor [Myxococcota bacterium]